MRGGARRGYADGTGGTGKGDPGARILIVDDQRSNLEFAQGLLEKLGLVAACAISGAAALAQLEEEHFAVVLMDLQMPDLDGYETTRRIIARMGEQAPPIFAVTAAAMVQHRQASLDAGMVEHIAKPIDPSDLVDALLRHIPPTVAADRPVLPLERAVLCLFDAIRPPIPR